MSVRSLMAKIRGTIFRFARGVGVGALLVTAALPARAQQVSASEAAAIRIDPTPPPTAADESSALAEKLQNPIADLISVPF